MSDRNELAKKLLKDIQMAEEGNTMKEVLKDNQIPFKVKSGTYRVRRPSYNEQLKVEDFRRKKYLELIEDDTMKFRKQWIEIYKKKNIDIDKMEVDMKAIQEEIEGLMIRLAQTENPTDVTKLETEIVALKEKQLIINIEKTDYLSYSIEDQIMITVNSYYTYIVLEKRIEVDNKITWEKAFKDYESFSNSIDNELINKAYYYINHIIYALPVFN